MSASESGLRAGDGVEFSGLLFEPIGMPAELLGGCVELVLVRRQGGTGQIGSWTAPRIDVAVPVEAHHGRGLDGFGEPAQVSGSLAELVRSGCRAHRPVVGA